MAAITQRIPSFLGGVSTQPDTKKIPGQLREALNVQPDANLGLIKRPAFKFLDNLVNNAGNEITSSAVHNDAKWFYINRDNNEVYIGCFKKDTSNTTDQIDIWNLVPDASGNVVKCAVTYSGSPGQYIQSDTPKDDIEIISVQDTSIIVNKSKTVAATATLAATEPSGTVLITTVEYSADYTVTITVGGSDSTVTTHTRNADTFSASGTTDTLLNADEILTDLKTRIDALGISGLTVVKGPTSLEFTKTSGSFTLEAKGGVNGTALSAFTDELETQANLPASARHGRVVKIVNTKVQLDPFYAKFVTNKGSGVGEGYWEETIAPGVSTGLDPSTMPHELVNTGTNAFTFKPITYINRLVGDDETNSHPSFVGKKINGAFFHSNRLGFLSDDNVIMSQAGDFFNFYHTTATTITASDPIDLSCSSTRPLQLHAAVPAPNGLVLISQNQQFLIFSESGSLTPRDSRITGLSNFEMDSKIPPVEVGTSFYFVSKTPAFSRVFSYTLTGVNTPPNVVDIAKVVTEYIPSSITDLQSSPQNSFIVLYSETDNTIYYYRFYKATAETEMQAWYKWVLPGKPLSLNVEKDVLYAVLQAGTKYFACTVNVTSTPSEAIVVSSDGNAINPYMDLYAPASALALVNGNTRITLPYTDVTGLDPVILIKGQVDFSTTLESGFTANVVKETVGGITYFSVPGRDLTSNGAANVIVGYKYAYDIHLPQIYLQRDPTGRNLDYTGYLGISRLKFSAGQTSTFGVKLKSKGIEGRQQDIQGDGSTTTFTLSFTPTDKNDIAVRINNIATTAFSINDSNQIVFTTAPASGQAIHIFEEFYFVRESVALGDYYLANDVAIKGEKIFTFPVNQRSDNLNVRVYSDSPFPISISSMVWEGHYAPKYYRRT